MVDYARRITGALDRADAEGHGTCLLFPVDDTAEIRAARATVADMFGADFRPETFPHVTLLYLGKGVEVDEDIDDAMSEIVQEAAVRGGDPMGVVTFDAPEGQPVPVVVELWSGLDDVQARALRMLAHKVTQPQFARYRAHITLGYLSRSPTEDESARLNVMRPIESVALPRLELRVGDEVQASWAVDQSREG